jgi:hypothetical protein
LNNIEGILPFYALLFLLAIPLIGCAPLVLAGVATGLIVAGPVLLVATAPARLPYAGSDLDPSFGTLVHDPLGLLVQLFITGEYPVLVYLAYICAGLAIGRLDLTSRRVAWWLLGGGIALAVVARTASALLLYPLGGLAALISAGHEESTLLWDAQVLLAEAESPISWWYLALPAPHSHTPVDLLHTLGSAGAVLGAALLLTRLPVLARALSPVAAAGSMALTLYSAHLVLLATGVLREQPVVLFLLMVLGAMAFAVPWRRWIGQGPLERMVAVLAGQARRRVADRLARRSPATTSTAGRRTGAGRRSTIARASQFLIPVAIAGALVLAYWGSTRFGPDRASTAGAEPGPSVAAEPPPTSSSGPSTEASSAPDLGRYCQLSQQVSALETQYPDDPEAVLDAAGVQLTDLPRVAPVEIRDAVNIFVTDIRARAGDTEVRAPDESALGQAETTIDTYEETNCP